jgi:hypothetical protein
MGVAWYRRPVRDVASLLLVMIVGLEKKTRNFNYRHQNGICKACPSESGTEVGASLFQAVELCDFSGRWQFMSGEIWYTLDSGSVLLTEAEAR